MLTMIAQPHATPSGVAAALYAPAKPVYRVRLASSAADLRAAQTLRFEVFNLELDEGLLQSYDTGQAHHLLNLSFAQYQADAGVVRLEHRIQTRLTALEEKLIATMACTLMAVVGREGVHR